MRHARILHVFDRAVNLIAGDEVLSLVTPEIGNGPFNVVLNWTQINTDDTDLNVGSGTQLNADNAELALHIGDLVIDVSAAALWNPFPDWKQLRVHRVRLQEQIPIMRNVLQRHAPANSLAHLVVELPAPSSPLERYVVNVAREHWGDLIRGARDLDHTRCTVSVRQLVGLGNGLTPAGDDWLLGCALAAHVGLPSPAGAKIILEAIRLSAPGTNPLSASWLRAAVDGACGERWHTFFACCLQADSRAVYRAALHIVQQGHSSGADALAGFLALLENE